MKAVFYKVKQYVNLDNIKLDWVNPRFIKYFEKVKKRLKIKKNQIF